MAESRLIGGYPVIGIRPTIDGRRGALKVRESLEDQTMGMAKAAKKLFEENLRYSNGEPVKVVIADTTIGRVAESAACAEKFKKEGVDITLTVTPCFQILCIERRNPFKQHISIANSKRQPENTEQDPCKHTSPDQIYNRKCGKDQKGVEEKHLRCPYQIVPCLKQGMPGYDLDDEV